MTQTTTSIQDTNKAVTFNLWDEPWIGVVLSDSSIERVSILHCLTDARRIRALHDQSPLVIAGTHRLLAAILQDIYRPQRVADIAALLNQGKLDPALIEAFGARYRSRFDLFSESTPFLQTADVPVIAGKDDKSKPVASLFFEEPSGTNVIHFWHLYENQHSICPACAAAGLVIQPAFATSGGAGIKPSINGVPPIYVLPIGSTLFETLALSLIVPDYQPRTRNSAVDKPPWSTDDCVVNRNEEILDVGYLESLTFPARRMRLHPHLEDATCTRCARQSHILVSTAAFEMGKSRPKGAPLWFDPFAAYRKRGNKEPVPVRPQAGKILWREYSTLFLSTANTPDVLPPNVVNQLSDLENEWDVSDEQLLRFRCIGVRTDMKAKIFEWIDEILDLPVGLLREPRGAVEVRRGIEHAEQCERDIVAIYQQHFRPQQGKRDRFVTLRERMRATYWVELSTHFRDFVLSSADPTNLDAAVERWVDSIIAVARASFEEAVEEVGDRGSDLRRRVQALQVCRARLASRRKEWLNANSQNSS